MKPQRLPVRIDIRPETVCDGCQARNSFRVISVHGAVEYLRCSHCGRTATRFVRRK